MCSHIVSDSFLARGMNLVDVTSASSSIPQKRSAPKEGTPAKPALTPEEVNEWKESLEECMEEARKLEHPSGVKY